MAGKRKEDEDDRRKEKPSKRRTRAKETESSTTQPPPPKLEDAEADVPWEHDDDREHRDHGKHHRHDHWESEAAEAIYTQLIEVRKVVEKLRQEAQEAKLRRRLELAPVRVGDLMRGFQAAVASANRSTRAGEQDSEDIERMSIKDLEVSVQAPIIEGGHAEDPVVMLPNIKSADAETAGVSLKFTVVSVPLKQRG